MIRRVVLRALTALFLFWLFWPRAWLPRAGDARPSDLASSGGPGLDGAPRSGSQALILLLAPDEDAFPAARVLRSAGVPYAVSRDPADAAGRRLVVVPLAEKMPRLDGPQRLGLKRFVSGGGTLLIQTTSLLPWPELTGLESAAPSRARRRLAFRTLADPSLAALPPALRRLTLAPESVSEGPWTAGLTPRRGAADVLAVFPGTRDAALTRRRIGDGRVLVLGADLRDLFVRLQAARGFDAARPGKPFAAAADAWPLLLAAWYESATPDWVRLRALPGDASTLLLLSHSIESGSRPAAARAWAARESARRLRTTWFVQTNDCDPGLPSPFYDARLARVVRDLAARGHELAAHTVVLPDGFESLPYGTGLETPRAYRPQTVDGRLWDATLMGEVRVPKRLLERDAPGVSVAGFRGPAFAYPEALDAALAGSGYAYDSSLAAAQVLTRRPFLLTRGRGMTAESGVVELPATFGGGEPPLPAPTADEVLTALAGAAAVEGVVVWDLRPEDAARGVEDAVLAALPPGAETETLGAAARWWAARARVRFWTEPGDSPGQETLRLSLPPEADGAALSFETARPIWACRSLTPDLEAECGGRRVVLRRTGGAREAALRLQFEEGHPPEARGVPVPERREALRMRRHRRALRRPHVRVPRRRPQR